RCRRGPGWPYAAARRRPPCDSVPRHWLYPCARSAATGRGAAVCPSQAARSTTWVQAPRRRFRPDPRARSPSAPGLVAPGPIRREWRRGVGKHQLADSRDLLRNALERREDVQAVGPQVLGEQVNLEADDVGEAAGGLADEGRLIAPAAMGCRR